MPSNSTQLGANGKFLVDGILRGRGDDEEVGNETQPGVIALHSISGKAEEEGDGDHHQEALF